MLVRHGAVVAEGWWSPYRPDGVHLLYSLSKSFTATAVGFAVSEGRLAVDDPVGKFFPDAVPAQHLQKMTVRHLLNHTSGIRSYTSLGPKWQRVMRNDLAPDSMVALFANEPFDFEPGGAYRYNNSGYFLLGVIIERLSPGQDAFVRTTEDHLAEFASEGLRTLTLAYKVVPGESAWVRAD